MFFIRVDLMTDKNNYFRTMYKAVVLLVLVAVSMAAETVQKRQVFLSSYPGAVNTVTYGGFPSVFYGGSPFVYGSPLFGGSSFVTFEQPKEKNEGDDKKEEKKEDEKKDEGGKKEGDEKDEVKTIQYIIPAFNSYPFWFRK
ncbi:hypothetical protein PRIPAC_80481 [Pristionchus pacificus]|uniref:Uncharacterized protein n=1 Tax=Pristionchus pacificus TaxID=54126 RepID=A0A2A6BHU9_PRIPA|nr:hypothetical protein PRIPAC_80481 [Pristionchus pacificus]|eukprot:PDM65433.1 hypothetical protein PRIPAC_52375 [Pristionchus pacificus]